MEEEAEYLPVEKVERRDYRITPRIRSQNYQPTNNMKTKIIDCIVSFENDEKITLCKWQRSGNHSYFSTNTLGFNEKYIPEIAGRNCTLKLTDVTNEDRYTNWECCVSIDNGKNDPYCDTIWLHESSVLWDFIFSKNMVKFYRGLLCGLYISAVIIIGIFIYLIFWYIVKIRKNRRQPEESVDPHKLENRERRAAPSLHKLENLQKNKNHQRQVKSHSRVDSRGSTSQESSRDTKVEILSTRESPVDIDDGPFVCRAVPNIYI